MAITKGLQVGWYRLGVTTDQFSQSAEFAGLPRYFRFNAVALTLPSSNATHVAFGEDGARTKKGQRNA
jgi:hypothetical protein